MFHVEHLKECPICKGTKTTFFLTCKDFTVTQEEFDIVLCENCGFKYTNPRPEPLSIGKYYESENYVSHSNTKAGYINKVYHFIKKIAINNKIKIIEDLKPNNKRILDIGCGTGSFLNAIKKRGWMVKGIEPNDKARNEAINQYSLDISDESIIKNLPGKNFSIITLWHVMEHVHSLKQRVIEIHDLLEEGGFAIIAVPNNTSWDAAHYKEYWAAYDVPRHLYHFTPKTIKNLFNNSGFKHFKSIPMKFDSYYVSLLSEKYKKSKFQAVQAFYAGIISNIKAKNDAEKYSSVIYIFQK